MHDDWMLWLILLVIFVMGFFGCMERSINVRSKAALIGYFWGMCICLFIALYAWQNMVDWDWLTNISCYFYAITLGSIAILGTIGICLAPTKRKWK